MVGRRRPQEQAPGRTRRPVSLRAPPQEPVLEAQLFPGHTALGAPGHGARPMRSAERVPRIPVDVAPARLIVGPERGPADLAPLVAGRRRRQQVTVVTAGA